MNERLDFERMLEAADEETRLQGLKGLSRTGMAESMGRLYTAMGDESWRVRKEAVEIFLALPAAVSLAGEVAELLHSQDNAGLRNAAVEILTRLGRQAVPSLLEELACSDHDVRKFALDILGQIGDPEATEAMIRALADPDDNVRAAAAENLGILRVQEAIPALVDALEGADLLMRFTILEALGEIGGPVPVDRLLPLGDERLVRKALFDCLGRVGREEAVPALVEGLVDDMSNVREAAVLALARIGGSDDGRTAATLRDLAGRDHGDALLELVDAPRDSVRQAAVTLLGWCGEQRHARRLLELFDDDLLRESAAAALVALGRSAARSLLELWPDADSRTRVYLAYVIGEAGCSEGRPMLRSALADPEPELRVMAARSLGTVGDQSVLQPLFDAVRDEVEEVREAAVQSLAALTPRHPERALEVLKPLLEAAEAEVRVCAVTVLGRLDGPDAGPLLNFALKDESPLVRRAAVGAIEMRPGEDQMDSLMLALTDEDADVRRLVAEALGASGDREAIEALALALQDEDIWVRAASVRALGRMGTPRALDLVRSALGDPVGLVGIAALETLAAVDPAALHDHALRALQHPDEEVVNAAINQLTATDDRRWLETAADDLLNHRHWEVRITFARALAALGGGQGVARLENRLLIEGEDLVRQELQDLLDDLQWQR